MRQRVAPTCVLWLGVLILSLTSCTSDTTTGPHGGDVVSLGNETAAEVVANAETGEVMVHTWDEALTTARPIEATPLMIGSGTNTLQLQPHRMPDDPAGLCSRFYGSADWIRGGRVRDGWIRHGDMARHEFGWRRCWDAGRTHGRMWDEMGGHGHRSGHGHGSRGG